MAADDVDIVRLLLPLVSGRSELDYIARLLDDGLAAAGCRPVCQLGRVMVLGSPGQTAPGRARDRGGAARNDAMTAVPVNGAENGARRWAA